MSWTTFGTLLVSVMALVASIGACVVAALSWRQSQSKSSSTLFARLTEIESTTEALSQNLHRLRSRVNALKFRDNGHASTAPTEPVDAAQLAAQTRAELNDQLARGLKVPP